MVEVIDRKTEHKMMMMILCGICYHNDYYLVYCIRRSDMEANIFVSKLIKGSLGYLISDDFDNGEKDILDGVIRRLLIKENKESLEKSGFSILKDIEMDSSLSFDIDNCYVCTVDKGSIKECLIYYELINKKMFSQPIVEVADDKRKFNEGFASNLALIIFGSVILIFVIIVLVGIIF